MKTQPGDLLPGDVISGWIVARTEQKTDGWVRVFFTDGGEVIINPAESLVITRGNDD
ncbi:MAG: hypothetical protein M0R66_02115 [Candidatus Omnitrophica bacterium]|jgi:hypothetical protein|nr:hypothetical protein [Sphaerochaeta sp.]MCK9603165.1 hypothetical protein [Candidatus Omnitrophota bacterium]